MCMCIMGVHKIYNNVSFLQVQKQSKESICFVGHTNAGKSSLINALFDTDCAVSPVAETKGADKVFENESIRVFDVFGVNENEMYASTKLLMQTKTVHVAILVYADCIENTRRTTRMLKSLGLLVIVVRNKVENYVSKPAELKLIEEEDSKKAAEYGATNWICVSAMSGYNISKLMQMARSVLSKAVGLV